MSLQSIPRFWLKTLLGLTISTIPGFADTSGNYQYTENDGAITITGYVTEPTEDLILPSTLNGKPVITIGSYAFQYCSGLTSVSIPTTVTSIGVDAFGSCSSLMDLTIPSSVTGIGDRAFETCTSLGDVTIPASVTSIGSGAFRSCNGLSSFTVEATNPNYSSTDGVLFNKLQTTLIQYPAQGPSETYTIPSTVTSIGDTAFGSCGNLTSVTIPTTVTSIGIYAFEGCSGLTGVTIPSSVASIGNLAFSDCPGLASLMVDATNPNYSSADGVLFDKLQSTLIQYPASRTGVAYIIPSNVTSLGGGAFQNCYSLTSVTIPSGVTSIGNSTFSYCSSLTSVTIPTTVTSIGDYAFEGCGGLTAVTIPSGVASIGNLAFYHCSALTSATFLGNAPAYMGFYVFNDAASGFTVYYSSGSTGFTSPTWMGYPAVATGGGSPLATWQTANGLSTSVDMLSTPNNDGVSLLMDYALGLDPNANESANLPKAVHAGNQLSMSYYGGRTDVTYTVKASTDLSAWTTTGVTLTAPDGNGMVTASVPANANAGFLKLMVRH